MYKIIPITTFLKEVKKLQKKYKSLITDIDELVTLLKENPTIGEPLGKDCYKIRLAIHSKNKGKSGGARMITCVKVVNKIVYLIAIYDKSALPNLSNAAIIERLKEIN